MFNKKGLVDSKAVIGSHFEINKSKLKVDSKLKGQFFTNEKGLVFYYEENFESPKDENSNDEDYDKYFEWINDDSGYTATGQDKKGYYKYIGQGQSKIEIPHVINGHPMTSYYKMFLDSEEDLKEVVSNNKNVTNMSGMFSGSRATTLDLSNFNTSSVKNMGFMFFGSKISTLDLSKFDTSNVRDVGFIFTSSDIKTVYARTQEDLDRFNKSSNKPANLVFKFKK